MNVIGLINARGQSKGVPGKNIKLLDGVPLLNWTIHTAFKAKVFDSIVVSTDDEKIAKIARLAGARIPFMRPAHLATDTSLQFETIYYVLKRLADNGEHYDAVAVLQPTCPLRSKDDILNCIKIMEKDNADTVITVMDTYGALMNTLYTRSKNGETKTLSKSEAKKGVLRQDHQKIYQRTGGVYLIKTSTILDEKKLYGSVLRSVVMDRSRSFDIDDMFDWSILEAWVTYHRIKEGHFS